MNRATGLLTALCLFGFSAALAWLISAPAVAARRPRIPAASSVPAWPPASTADVLMAKYERQLTGGDAPDTGPWNGEMFERMLTLSWAGSEGVRDLREYVDGWLRHEPAGALAWIENHGSSPGSPSDDYTRKAASVFDSWAKIDLESALAAAARLSHPEARAQALISSLQSLWKTDPARTRAIYEQNLDLFIGRQWFKMPFDHGDTAGRNLEFLQTLPSGKARANLLSRLLMDIANSSHPAPAVSFWETAPLELQQDLISNGFLGNPDPYAQYSNVITALTGAEDLVRTHVESTGDARNAAAYLESHGGVLASRDLPAALAWTREHVRGKAGMDYAVRLIGAAAGDDFDMAVRTWQSLPWGALKSEAAGAIVSYAKEDRKPEALALLETFPTRNQRAARWAAGLDVESYSHPSGAKE